MYLPTTRETDILQKVRCTEVLTNCQIHRSYKKSGVPIYLQKFKSNRSGVLIYLQNVSYTDVHIKSPVVLVYIQNVT